MLALPANVGDIAIRSDINQTFILQTAGASMLGNWIQILTPSSPVQSVNGQTGNVSITASNLSGLGDAATKGVVGNSSSVRGASGTFAPGNLVMTDANGSGNEVDSGISASDVVTIDGTQTINGPKTFSEGIVTLSSIAAVSNIVSNTQVAAPNVQCQTLLVATQGSNSLTGDNSHISFNTSSGPQIQVGTSVALPNSSFGMQVGETGGEYTQTSFNGIYGGNGGTQQFSLNSVSGMITGANLTLTSQPTSTTASGGSSQALPAQPVGYLILSINGANLKIPFYF
jgi:hypothetical protein